MDGGREERDRKGEERIEREEIEKREREGGTNRWRETINIHSFEGDFQSNEIMITMIYEFIIRCGTMKYFHVIIDYIFVQLENTNEKKNTARQVESR